MTGIAKDADEACAGCGLILRRVFDAPRELLFKAWTEPERLMRWWGPKGFTSPYWSADLRPCGESHYCMRSPDGHDYWSKGIYREIVEPERLVYIETFSDADGNAVAPSYYGMEGDVPLEMLVTVLFEERDSKTEITLRHAGIPEGEITELARMGWSQSLDRLEEYLEEAV